ncbi:hypothetical protein MRB53_041310 [Persea americana]|nr:hypothetical protein MRB53_041310 [Persea americana]
MMSLRTGGRRGRTTVLCGTRMKCPDRRPGQYSNAGQDGVACEERSVRCWSLSTHHGQRRSPTRRPCPYKCPLSVAQQRAGRDKETVVARAWPTTTGRTIAAASGDEQWQPTRGLPTADVGGGMDLLERGRDAEMQPAGTNHVAGPYRTRRSARLCAKSTPRGCAVCRRLVVLPAAYAFVCPHRILVHSHTRHSSPACFIVLASFVWDRSRQSTTSPWPPSRSAYLSPAQGRVPDVKARDRRRRKIVSASGLWRAYAYNHLSHSHCKRPETPCLIAPYPVPAPIPDPEQYSKPLLPYMRSLKVFENKPLIKNAS